MMKKNKLYTANRWNQPMFMPNRFDLGGLAAADKAANPWDYADDIDTIKQFLNNDRGKAYASTNTFGISKADNPFSKINLAGGIGAMANTPIGGSLIGGLAGSVGTLGGNAIAGGLSSKAGNAISSVGSTVGGALSSVNPLIGGIVSVGSGLVGGLVNRAFGTKVDQAKLDAVNAGTAALSNFNSNASSFDDIEGPIAQSDVQDAYSGGWFSSGDAERKNEELRRQRKEAQQWAFRSLDNNVFNIVNDQMDNALASYSAFGGPIDSMDGAIGYDFMNDYLTQKNKQSNIKNKTKGLSLMPAFMPKSFAIGGVLQTHGGDFSDGLTSINAGLSHEENPNEGVQMGVDNEGTPNLVEQGETIYNDYVFSNRILADAATKQMFRLPRKKDITFADISKRLEKEIAERPNDPISKAGFEKQMEMLEEQQERQKQEMEAERAKAAFEALSPEEQTALMQQRTEQEAMAQAAQEQAIAEQQAMQQPSPEEAAMMQQQMQVSPEEQLAQMQANVSALGGQLVKASDVEPQANKFANGGRKARKIVQKYNKDWFSQMAKALGISEDEFSTFNDRFTEDNPEANLATFNDIYRASQEAKARETYRTGQRQSKRNELFGDKGLYRYSANKKYLYRGRVNDADRVGYINKDYTGDADDKGAIIGFLSTEDYNKKKAAYEAEKDEKKKAKLLNELEGYHPINEKAGDYMYDFYGKRLETPETMSEDEILKQYDADYAKGFKWDDKDVQAIQYPVSMEHSATSAMRYIPAIGGAIGLGYDLLNSPDYSRPQAVIDAASGLSIPERVFPHYVGNYLTYRPLDIWYGQNALNAQSRATDRQLMNTSGGNRGTAMAGLISNGYNSQLASGNLFRQAQEYNDNLRKQVADFNKETNIFNANADMESQKTNATLRQQAGRLGLHGLATGYGMMDDIDARRQASMNANLTNVLQSLGNIGEEAYDDDRVKWLERTGVLRSNTHNANGGRLNKKKRGLTI